MVVALYKLPVCDVCGLPWLPTKWTPASDPRDTEKPLRCGKCKSSGWDREHKSEVNDVQVRSGGEASAEVLSEMPREGDAEDASQKREVDDSPTGSEPAEVRESVPTPPAAHGRCRHRLTNCPICSKEAD